MPGHSNLRIEVEEGLQAGLQLLFYFVLTTFEQVHGYVRLPAVLEFEGRIANLRNFLGGQQVILPSAI
jgi:hypothetical protein